MTNAKNRSSFSDSKAEAQLRNMPIAQMLDLYEGWLRNHNAKVSDPEYDIQQARETALNLFKQLVNKLNGLWRKQRMWQPDELRNRIISLLEELKVLATQWSSKVNFLLSEVWDKTRNFLINYGFARMTNLSELYNFIDRDEEKMQWWNDVKFNAFILHISSISTKRMSKVKFFARLLSLDSVRGCSWNEESYKYLAQVLEGIDDNQEGQVLKRMFNALPWVQQDRRPWWKSSKDPWRTLYYKQNANVSWEARWHVSILGSLPSRMWALALNHGGK